MAGWGGWQLDLAAQTCCSRDTLLPGDSEPCVISVYSWLCWVFITVRGAFSSCGKWGLLPTNSLDAGGFALCWLLLLRSTCSRHMDYAVVA